MANVKYVVTFEDSEKPDEWHVSRGEAPGDNMQFIIHSPTQTFEEELEPGFYVAQISIGGTNNKKAKLTISRPKFADKVVLVSIHPGTGQGINLTSFRVVEAE
jgi:hypothetical protein